MNVLVACEESQAVTIEFRKRGHRAFSCDLQECSGGHPEWHINGDALKLIDGNCEFVTQDGHIEKQDGEWDLIIAHPPCTYLTNMGAARFYRKEKMECKGVGSFQMINIERLKNGILGRDFFMSFYNANCKKIAIENPIPMTIFCLPKYTQTIQPYQFGEPYSKKTCLWLKGLDTLKPTKILDEYQPFINGGGGRMEKPNYKGKTFAEGSKQRSKTFVGIARAMAEQWG